ncbi:MAG: TIGR02302 family protein [Rhodospirillaceae bacterium]
MTDTAPETAPSFETGSVPGVNRLVALARLVLGWERLWRAGWRAACVVGIFFALALFDVLPRLPGWLHALVLVVILCGLGLALFRGFTGFRWPKRGEALRRLERDNGLLHRPLGALDDRVATDDPVAVALWRIHCRAMAGRVLKLRPPRPRSDVAVRDPFGLRVAVGLVLVTALVAGGGDGFSRLGAALTPSLNSSGFAVPAAFDLWLAPPDYTGLPPVFLHRAADSTVASVREAPVAAVPVGSTVLARLSGGSGVPVLTVNGADRAFSVVDETHFQVRATVEAGNALRIAQGGRRLGYWDIRVVPDAPPVIAFAAPPSPGPGGTLKLDYRAGDDYGVKAVSAIVRPQTPAGAGEEDEEPMELALPLPGLERKTVRGGGTLDLTSSPRAGQPVSIHLLATDNGGNHAESEQVSVVLPERNFLNPVAREIIARRKELAIGGAAASPSVAAALSALSVRAGAFHDDAVVFLGLRVAVSRLALDRGGKARASVRALLWDLALRLEDGGLTLAGRDLRAAEQALAEALERNASPEELGRLMDELQAALDRFLDTLDRQPTANGARPPLPGPPVTTVERSDIEAMMRSLRDMGATGARDDARKMLSDMRRMLGNLQTGGGIGSAADAKALETLRGLQELTEHQRALRDRATGPASPEPTADEQAELRRRLGSLMEQLGEGGGSIPHAFGQAERAMRDAEMSLRLDSPGAAVPAQNRAVDSLREGLRAVGRQQAASGRDPLGRMMPGRGTPDSAGVRVPEEREIQRAREILDELRRRANQRERPRRELDYIDRLLRQF